jgi:hypothetical protein
LRNAVVSRVDDRKELVPRVALEPDGELTVVVTPQDVRSAIAIEVADPLDAPIGRHSSTRIGDAHVGSSGHVPDGNLPVRVLP